MTETSMKPAGESPETLKSYSDSYKAAGVDVTAGYRSVELIKEHVKRTAIPGVVSGIGGFGGLFAPNVSGMEEPILVSGTDGVGTKLKIAMLMDRHDTIGIDAVAMCVNDVVCCGAKPLFFLDYIACGKNIPEKVASIVKGVAEGCVQAGCALVGGETAEHPGMMAYDDYDIAGFTVGLVDKPKLIDGSRLQAGDVLIGLASSGLHSNGFSLVRKVFGIGKMDIGEETGKGMAGALMNLTVSVAKTLKGDMEIVNRRYNELGGTLGETLLTPTRIYVKAALSAIEKADVKAISHITGGGFYENIPRMMVPGLTARVEKAAVPVQPIFGLLQKEGNIPEHDMYNTFNMGAGMCMAVSKETAQTALNALIGAGERPFVMGEVVKGEEGVVLC